MISIEFFLIMVTVIFGLGVLLPMLATVFRFSRPWLDRISTMSLGLAFLGSSIGIVVGLLVWLGTSRLSSTQPIDLWQVVGQDFVIMPPLQISFQLDPLSAFFTFLVSGFSALVAVYSFGALNAPHYRLYRNQISSGFNIFVWATIMVFMAYDMFTLILTLEIMTLAFGFLAVYKHILYQDEERTHPVTDDKQKNARVAPQVYLAVSHTSTAFLLIALLLLTIMANYDPANENVGSLDMSFDKLIDNRLPSASGISTLVFLLALAGLGIRAGLTPAHFWVSLVHPSSPTTTHALSLGIAIKVAVYLMYRFFFQFLEPEPWWGQLLLLIAVLTAFVNVWYAISSHDLKTALAYHSIENIGIICAGMGVAMIFWTENKFISSLAIIASLYHLLNHAVFKGLLYFATGAIDNLTHQVVEFNKLGGLVKRYGFTSAMFLVGSFSIAGFPPFNGFISEWLTLHALFGGLGAIDQGNVSILLVILGSLGLLAASFALTAFCFYKMAGVTLLGRARSPEIESAKWELRDVPLPMKTVMGLMASLCLILGLLPGTVIPLLALATEPLGIQIDLSGLQPAGQIQGWMDVSFGADSPSPYLPILTLVGLVLGLSIILLLIYFSRSGKQTADAWNCGAPIGQMPVNQYTSTAASFLLRDQLTSFTPAKYFTSAHDYLPDEDAF